jgi:hypothetical protein
MGEAFGTGFEVVVSDWGLRVLMIPSDPLSQFPSKGQRRQEEHYYRFVFLWSPRKDCNDGCGVLTDRFECRVMGFDCWARQGLPIGLETSKVVRSKDKRRRFP